MNLHEEDLKQNGYQGDENCAVNDERLREVPGTPEEGVKQHNANNESVVPKKTEETWDEFIDRVFPDLPPVRVQYVTWDQFLPTLHNNPKIRKFVPPSRQFRVAEPKYTVDYYVVDTLPRASNKAYAIVQKEYADVARQMEEMNAEHAEKLKQLNKTNRKRKIWRKGSLKTPSLLQGAFT